MELNKEYIAVGSTIDELMIQVNEFMNLLERMKDIDIYKNYSIFIENKDESYVAIMTVQNEK